MMLSKTAYGLMSLGINDPVSQLGSTITGIYKLKILDILSISTG